MSGLENWTYGGDRQGYLLGNGRLYLVAGLSTDLRRERKSAEAGRSPSLTRIAWVVGPDYGMSNLGFGWEVLVQREGVLCGWDHEEVLPPRSEEPAWRVRCRGPDAELVVEDVLLEDRPTLALRRLRLSRPAGAPTLTLVMPVYPDERNLRQVRFDGAPLPPGHPQIRPSVPTERALRVVDDCLVLEAAPRRLFHDIAFGSPDPGQRRVLATRLLAIDGSASLDTVSGGQALVWNLPASDTDHESRAEVVLATAEEVEDAVALAGGYRAGMACPATPRWSRPPLTSDAAGAEMIEALACCADLTCASQGRCGGVFAQPVVYPMNYVRDQMGSLRLLLALGEWERARRVVSYHVAMQNRWGIQNAQDATAEDGAQAPFDPSRDYAGIDGEHRIAEVPSWVVLMIREYHRATADDITLAAVYPRLAYNLRCQTLSCNQVAPSPGDESYTNLKPFQPAWRTEMTDSSLLLLAAARFGSAAARHLGQTADAAEFAALAERVQQGLDRRMWRADLGHWLYARSDDDDAQHVDARPVLDPLLRWIELDIGDADDARAWSCLQVVLDRLVDPVRVVPEDRGCAGMDPGYLLSALARVQHPAMHAAARLLCQYRCGTTGYAEYYQHDPQAHRILPTSVLRPWETAIAGAAFLRYLVGCEIDAPARRIVLRPHLPPGWTRWSWEGVAVPGLGRLALALERTTVGILHRLILAEVVAPFEIEVEAGGYGPVLARPPWRVVPHRQEGVVAWQVQAVATSTQEVLLDRSWAMR